MNSSWSSIERPLRLVFGLAIAGQLACAHPRTQPTGPSSVLVINTEEVGADVYVDGAYVGQVSAVSGKTKLAPGTHRVEVRLAGHFPVQRTVLVAKRPANEVVVEAELLSDPR